MSYLGVIIEESLADKAILDELKVINTRIEKVDERQKTPWLKQWTLHQVEVNEENADSLADRLSHSLDKEHNDWYIDYKDEYLHYIIFLNKVFKVDRRNAEQYKEAIGYGVALGIPDYQLDFETVKDD